LHEGAGAERNRLQLAERGFGRDGSDQKFVRAMIAGRCHGLRCNLLSHDDDRHKRIPTVLPVTDMAQQREPLCRATKIQIQKDNIDGLRLKGGHGIVGRTAFENRPDPELQQHRAQNPAVRQLRIRNQHGEGMKAIMFFDHGLVSMSVKV